MARITINNRWYWGIVMATLGHLVPPPPLPYHPPPTVAALISQVDPWVIYHFRSTLLSNVHYENQLYGVLNLFFSSIFPKDRRFMVIPQGLLRKVLDADEVEDLADVSFGSAGGWHESRNLDGPEVHKFVPDFMVMKVILQPYGSPVNRNHRILVVVEVKRNEDASEISALEQTMGYLERAYQQPSHDPELCAYLVMGRRVTCIRMENGSVVTDIPFDIFETTDPFTTDLASISLRNWN